MYKQYQPIILTFLAMIFFAGNSILCRLALKHTSIDPTSFTSIRLMSGTIMLNILIYFRRKLVPIITVHSTSNTSWTTGWLSAFALFIYALGFSYAYVNMPAGTGALILFSAVQATMLIASWWSGTTHSKQQIIGIVIALIGLILFMLPGLTKPPIVESILMSCAGIAWGIYSLMGRKNHNALDATAATFSRALVLCLIVSMSLWSHLHVDIMGIWYAVCSGAIASAIGYAMWNAALPNLSSLTAASVQLSVPIITMVTGALLLNESLTLPLIVTSALVLSGIALVLVGKNEPNRTEK